MLPVEPLPDLANELIRETYRGNKSRLRSWSKRDPLAMRRAIAHSKRFTLDDGMASFLGELSTVPFKVASQRRPDVLDSLRHSARLPFPQMFFQYNYRALRRGLNRDPKAEMLGVDGYKPPAPDDKIISQIGWLVEVDHRDPDLIWLQEFAELDGGVVPLPLCYAYRTDDHGFDPRLKLDTFSGMIAHGIEGYICPNIGVQLVAASAPPENFLDIDLDGVVYSVHKLVMEFGGSLRYMLALLATLNDIPKIQTQVRPQKSYMGGGQIRKYLDYTTLTLTLPASVTTTRLAKRLIAASRKGWHEVRPHWRINHPPLSARFCSQRSDHIWLEADERGHANCKLCDARRVWIVLPDGRGDPTISVRTHKYALHHSES
jgi:hypothetical protein